MHNTYINFYDMMPNVFFNTSISAHSQNTVIISKCNFIIVNSSLLFYHSVLLLLLLLPNLFRGMGAWRRSWSPRSRETPQGWDQRSERDRESPKSERRKESVAGQCRIKSEVSWDECPQALQDGFSILPILER